MSPNTPHIAFIGSAGIPNRYGGFESFLEHCSPVIAQQGYRVSVSCDASLYADQSANFKGVRRVFLAVRANGASSIVHDLLAFFKVFRSSTHIVVLGVSGGLWFPLFRLMCGLTGKRLLVNIDGIEWRRSKFGRSKRALLWVLDTLAQRFAHAVIYDSEGLLPYLGTGVTNKAFCIKYPGDHVLRHRASIGLPGTALTICRIEPENNLEMLIEGFLGSGMASYTVIGNWSHSSYAKGLRQRYAKEPRLRLLDPIYDAHLLAEHRESCSVYLHGHSVGGTNPSLVEMLFYDCTLLCFDVDFNRHTALDCAQYFDNAGALSALLDAPSAPRVERSDLREQYSASRIAKRYIAAMGITASQAATNTPSHS